MADMFLEHKELMPKDLLQFVETRPERAIEVLREILDVPNYEATVLGGLQAVSPMTNIAWTSTGNTISGASSLGFANQQQQNIGGVNG